MLTKKQEVQLKKITEERFWPTPLVIAFLQLDELKKQTKLLEKIREELMVKS